MWSSFKTSSPRVPEDNAAERGFNSASSIRMPPMVFGGSRSSSKDRGSRAGGSRSGSKEMPEVNLASSGTRFGEEAIVNIGGPNHGSTLQDPLEKLATSRQEIRSAADDGYLIHDSPSKEFASAQLAHLHQEVTQLKRSVDSCNSELQDLRDARQNLRSRFDAGPPDPDCSNSGTQATMQADIARVEDGVSKAMASCTRIDERLETRLTALALELTGMKGMMDQLCTSDDAVRAKHVQEKRVDLAANTSLSEERINKIMMLVGHIEDRIEKGSAAVYSEISAVTARLEESISKTAINLNKGLLDLSSEIAGVAAHTEGKLNRLVEERIADSLSASRARLSEVSSQLEEKLSNIVINATSSLGNEVRLPENTGEDVSSERSAYTEKYDRLFSKILSNVANLEDKIESSDVAWNATLSGLTLSINDKINNNMVNSSELESRLDERFNKTFSGISQVQDKQNKGFTAMSAEIAGVLFRLDSQDTFLRETSQHVLDLEKRFLLFEMGNHGSLLGSIGTTSDNLNQTRDDLHVPPESDVLVQTAEDSRRPSKGSIDPDGDGAIRQMSAKTEEPSAEFRQYSANRDEQRAKALAEALRQADFRRPKNGTTAKSLLDVHGSGESKLSWSLPGSLVAPVNGSPLSTDWPNEWQERLEQRLSTACAYRSGHAEQIAEFERRLAKRCSSFERLEETVVDCLTDSTAEVETRPVSPVNNSPSLSTPAAQSLCASGTAPHNSPSGSLQMMPGSLREQPGYLNSPITGTRSISPPPGQGVRFSSASAPSAPPSAAPAVQASHAGQVAETGPGRSVPPSPVGPGLRSPRDSVGVLRTSDASQVGVLIHDPSAKWLQHFSPAVQQSPAASSSVSLASPRPTTRQTLTEAPLTPGRGYQPNHAPPRVLPSPSTDPGRSLDARLVSPIRASVTPGSLTNSLQPQYAKVVQPLPASKPGTPMMSARHTLPATLGR